MTSNVTSRDFAAVGSDGQKAVRARALAGVINFFWLFAGRCWRHDRNTAVVYSVISRGTCRSGLVGEGVH